MNEQQQKQEPKRIVAIPMYDEPLLEAQQDEREMREIFQRQQRWSNYPI